MKIKPAVNLLFGVFPLCIVADPALAQPVLTLEGSCPGEMRTEVMTCPRFMGQSS